MHDFVEAYRGWIDESMKKVRHFRDGRLTESVAVGSREFVTETKEKLGVRAKGRKVVGAVESCELREPPSPYRDILGHENVTLRLQNEYFWQNIV